MTDLNRNEFEALRILWERGESKPADIENEFAWNIDNGTLRSVLKVLMDKGHVTRRKEGKAYFYKSVRSREGMLAKMARQMAEIFSGGSTAGLIAQLVKSEKLSAKDIEELRRIANGSPAKRRGRKESI